LRYQPENGYFTMTSLETTLTTGISQGLQNLFGITADPSQLALQPTRKEFAGTYTFVTFPYTKAAGKSPDQIGQGLGEYLQTQLPEVTDFNIVKGFLNLVVSDQTWISVLQDLVINKVASPRLNKEKVVVEYSSPNTNKPLHLGHLRNNFLGYSVAEILKANGSEVVKVNLVNDRGIHICKSMVAYQLLGAGETPESAGIKGDHLAGKYYVAFDKLYKEQISELITQGEESEKAKKEAPIMQQAQNMLRRWEQGDAATLALWKQMNGWVYAGFEETYQNIGVDFDKFYYESETYLLGKDSVSEGLASGVFYQKPDGSVWVDLTQEGLDEKLVLRADGTSVYITQDLGTAELKYQDFKYDRSIYVIADEQNYHMQVLKAILQKLNKSYANGIYHLSYGMVDLPSGKMKSREGTVVDADELVVEMIETARQRTEELGKIEGLTGAELQQLYHTLAMGALKYFLLKVDPKKRMLFNPEESINFQGNTGPFIQYTHARISSILRKAIDLKIDGGAPSFTELKKLHETESEVVAILAGYEKVVAEAAGLYAPSVIGQYAYELAKAYNRFYTEVSIFQETDPQALNFRVALSKQVAQKINKAMGLLGIQVPDRM